VRLSKEMQCLNKVKTKMYYKGMVKRIPGNEWKTPFYLWVGRRLRRRGLGSEIREIKQFLSGRWGAKVVWSEPGKGMEGGSTQEGRSLASLPTPATNRNINLCTVIQLQYNRLRPPFFLFPKKKAASPFGTPKWFLGWFQNKKIRIHRVNTKKHNWLCNHQELRETDSNLKAF
jgi:hypothetical protein